MPPTRCNGARSTVNGTAGDFVFMLVLVLVGVRVLVLVSREPCPVRSSSRLRVQPGSGVQLQGGLSLRHLTVCFTPKTTQMGDGTGRSYTFRTCTNKSYFTVTAASLAVPLRTSSCDTHQHSAVPRPCLHPLSCPWLMLRAPGSSRSHLDRHPACAAPRPRARAPPPQGSCQPRS